MNAQSAHLTHAVGERRLKSRARPRLGSSLTLTRTVCLIHELQRSSNTGHYKSLPTTCPRPWSLNASAMRKLIGQPRQRPATGRRLTVQAWRYPPTSRWYTAPASGLERGPVPDKRAGSTRANPGPQTGRRPGCRSIHDHQTPVSPRKE